MAKQKSEQLSSEIRSSLNAACDLAMVELKKEYHDPLLPFEKYAEKVRLELNKTLLDAISKSQHGRSVLKEYLLQEEKENPQIAEDARWATWEKKAHTLYKQILDGTFSLTDKANQKPIQEQFGISWNFLDRVYRVADKLIDEAKYPDAAAICDLLILIHSNVPAYWIRKAAALFGAGSFESALYQYMFSLRFDPEDPYIYFEMARCYFQLNEPDHCLASLDLCVKYCGQDKKFADLTSRAKNIKQAIESKKLK